MAGAERAMAMGRLAGVHAVANLVHGALAVVAETRAAMIAAFAEAAIIHRRFMEVAHDLDAGHAPKHEAGVADAAFRPNFNSRKADEFFAAEEWTEAVMRYSMAGETLVREVMTAVAQAVGKPELASTDKLNQFRSLGESIARQVDVSLAKEPAWAEFTRTYGLRNTLYAHGQEEAALSAAVEARAAWEGLRAMLATLFAAIGVTVAGIQGDALKRRAEDWSREDISKVEAMTAVAEAARRRGLDRLHKLVSEHDPKQPASLGEAIQALSPAERELADGACEVAMAAGFETVKQLWDVATDTASILTVVVLGSAG